MILKSLPISILAHSKVSIHSHLFAVLISFCTVFTITQAAPNRYAENFTIERFETHKVLTVTNLWRGSGDTSHTYVLVPKDSPIPTVNLPANAQIIRTPVTRMISMATVYLGHIQELQLHDQLVAVSYLSHTNDPLVRQKVEEGKIKSIPTGSALDVEALMLLQPDILFTSSTGTPAFDVHPQLIRAKLPVVLTSGYMENHPLARAEWIKFIAAFVNKDEQAEIIFNKISERYETLAALTRNLTERPTLFSNAPYGGKWHLPGGQSYSAQAFADAGGDYLWAKDTSRGGIPLDFERVYYKAAYADFWLNPSSHLSIKALLQSDERFAKFNAVREGNVFNNTQRLNPGGGNDIWERGICHPEEVLADLIKVLHPKLLPDHELIFYQKID